MTGQSAACATTLRRKAAELVAGLSLHEHRVLDLIVDGYSLTKIARDLGRSLEDTVRTKAALMRKLEAMTTADLVRVGLCAQAAADR